MENASGTLRLLRSKEACEQQVNAHDVRFV